MENSKHTPAPWKIDIQNKSIVKGNFRTVAFCDLSNGSFGEENDANAKLIASAPELLQALIELRNSKYADVYDNSFKFYGGVEKSIPLATQSAINSVKEIDALLKKATE